MKADTSFIPVIDLFAGPGGLGEGFSSVTADGKRPFKTVLSVECDPYAYETLLLRAFLRAFKYQGKATPRQYFWHIENPKSYTRSELFSEFEVEAQAATTEACRATLGEAEGDQQVWRRLKQLRDRGIDLSRSIVIGGPPCQAYSLVGRSRRSRTVKSGEYVDSNDGRHTLYLQYLKLLEEIKPCAFVMENVQGILSSKYEGRLIFPQIINDLKAAGYELHGLGQPKDAEAKLFATDHSHFLLAAEKYGVPQQRSRVIVVGTRSDIEGIAIKALPTVKKLKTVKEAIGDLPKLRSGLSKGDCRTDWNKAVRSSSMKIIDELQEHGTDIEVLLHEIANPKSRIGGKDGRGGGIIDFRRPDASVVKIYNHETRGHIEGDLCRYLFYSSWAKTTGNNLLSPKLSDLPKALLPKHKNLEKAKKSNQRNAIQKVAFLDRFRVQVANKPATTITSHISKDGHYYIHYDPRQCRSLTVREAARLQTFPDDYIFCGPRTEQYKQVGNAVPPQLASLIALELWKSIFHPGAGGT